MNKLTYWFLAVMLAAFFLSAQVSPAVNAFEHHPAPCADNSRIVFKEDIKHREHLIATFFVLYSAKCKTAWADLEVTATGFKWETGAYVQRSDGVVALADHSRQHHVVTKLCYLVRLRRGLIWLDFVTASTLASCPWTLIRL